MPALSVHASSSWLALNTPLAAAPVLARINYGLRPLRRLLNMPCHPDRVRRNYETNIERWATDHLRHCKAFTQHVHYLECDCGATFHEPKANEPNLAPVTILSEHSFTGWKRIA